MNIQQIREKFPMYDDLSDQQLIDGVYNKYYSDMDQSEFYQKVGFNPRGFMEQAGDVAQRVLENTPVGQILKAPQDSGFQRGLRDPIDAGAQMLEKVVPEAVRTKINQLNDWLVSKGVPLQELGEGGLQGMLDQMETEYQQDRISRGEDPDTIDPERLAGGVVGGLATGGILGAPLKAATAAGRVGLGAAGGAAGGALSEPVVGDQEDFWKQKAIQTGLGAATGGLWSGGAELLGATGRRANSADVQDLQSRGVQPTVGQAIGGIANDIEQKAVSLPVAGDMINRARRQTFEQFQTAALNDALEPIGRKVEGAGHDAIKEAQDMVSDAYEKAARKTNGIVLDETHNGLVNQLRTEGTAHLDEVVANDFERFMQKVFDAKRSPNGNFTRDSFEELDKAISRKARNATNLEAREMYQSLRDILLDQAEAANPQYAELYRRARTASAKLMRVEKAANASSKNEGISTPAQLVRAATQMDTSSRKRAAAAGDALMQELGERGERVLGSTVPNSGTTDRALQNALLASGGGYMVDPNLGMAVGGGLAGLTALYTDPAQRAVLKAMQELEDMRGGAGLGYLSGQVSGDIASGY
jgi:hypothetical protein